jgi:isopentenyl phosphate kinase
VKDIIPLMVGDMCFTKTNCVAIVAIDTIVMILCYEGNKVIITTKRFFIVKQLGFWPICNNLV